MTTHAERSSRAALLLSTLLSIAALASLPGCDRPGAAGHHTSPVVLAEAQGICPTHVVYGTTPNACRLTHWWNAATPLFTTPRRLWGVAYAFNCGARAGDFGFDARLTAMDHMVVPGGSRHARSGTGVFMIPAHTMLQLLKSVPQEFKGDGAYTEVDIASACTWHVKAVLGSHRDVAASIPPVPRVESHWWQKGHSGH
jgi:hypothetical protein